MPTKRKVGLNTQFTGISAYGTPSALEPGWISQAGSVGLPTENPIQRNESIYTTIYSCQDVGGTVSAPAPSSYSNFNIGQVPLGCTIVSASLNAHGSINADSGANYIVGLGETLAIPAPIPPGFGSEAYEFETTFLSTGTIFANKGVVELVNVPITEDTGTYVVLRWDTDVGNGPGIGPTTGTVCVKVTYVCP